MDQLSHVKSCQLTQSYGALGYKLNGMNKFVGKFRYHPLSLPSPLGFEDGVVYSVIVRFTVVKKHKKSKQGWQKIVSSEVPSWLYPT